MKKFLEIDIIPKFFKLQWHITERCNFRCLHCYQDNFDTPEMPLEQMEEVLRQFVFLIKKWGISPYHSFLSLGGGEPLLYQNFFSFLARVYKYSANYQWGLMSNGSLLNRKNIRILKSFKIAGCQISLEGLEKNNDEIRGEGSFKKALKALTILKEEGIHTSVGLTVTKKNINDVLPLINLLDKIGINKFRVRRLVLWGQGSQLIDSLLEPPELLSLYRKLEEVNKDLFKKGSNLRITQWCENGFFWTKQLEKAYCGINDGRILTLLSNGDVYPCRRLPIKIGNILENSLEEIYYSEENKKLRNPEEFPQYCRQNCFIFNRCFGGAKCITYAYSGRLDIPDVQCPYVYSALNKNLCCQNLTPEKNKHFVK